MITSIHHESLYPVIKILQKKRILLQPFSSKVLSKKTLIPCSWALQKQRLLNFLQTLLIIHGFFKSHFLTIRDFNIAKVLLNIKRSTHFNLQVFCSDHFICIQQIFATMSSDEFKKWQPQSKNFSLWLPF